MVDQGIIILWSNGPDLGKIVPSDKGKIVMLVVITYVKCQFIYGSIITVSFLWIGNEIVFLYPSCTKWVQSDCEK